MSISICDSLLLRNPHIAAYLCVDHITHWNEVYQYKTSKQDVLFRGDVFLNRTCYVPMHFVWRNVWHFLTASLPAHCPLHKMRATSSKCIQLRAPEPLNLSQVGSLGCLVVLVGGMRVLEASVCIYAQYLGRIRMTNRRLDAYSIDVSLFTNTTHESGDDNTIFLVRCSKKGPFSRLLLLSQQYHFTYLKIVKKS